MKAGPFGSSFCSLAQNMEDMGANIDLFISDQVMEEYCPIKIHVPGT